MPHSILNNSSNYSSIVENYNRICYNANNAKIKYSTNDEKVKIMAVTKTVPAEIVNKVIDLGIDLLGENRVQEFLEKKDLYNDSASVHFIGHLQTNKVKYIINDVSLIQSVDSFKLACEIDKLALKNNKIMDMLIEVNIGQEESKSGVLPKDVDLLIDQISQLKNVKVRGFMGIPPKNADESLYFNLQCLYNNYKCKKQGNIDMSILSVGMSNDYETAIKYGSNLIRIGTGLFGARI